MRTVAEQIKEDLHKGVVTFTFTKKDGSTRTAVGTLQTNILTEKLGDWKPNRPSSPKVQVFFDMEKNEFRSFSLGSEIEVLDFKEYEHE